MLVVLVLTLLLHPFMGVFFIPVISLMRSSKGVEFDVQACKAKLYYNFLGIRMGGWISYLPNDELWLHKSSYFERETLRTSRFQTGGNRSYYFDVYLIRQNGDNVELRSFTSDIEAYELLVSWSQKLGLKGVDHFGPELIESIERNKSGRRRR